MMRIFLGVVVGVFLIWLFVARPTVTPKVASTVTIDPARLQGHVEKLSVEFHPRDYKHLENLDRSAAYIHAQFEEAGAEVSYQDFTVEGRRYRNVIGRFGVGKGRTRIVGAHYDSVHGTPGADDNASGVAGLIELGHLLGQTNLEHEVELVAYSLEEPPFFATTNMGSAVHANAFKKSGRELAGVLVLEMIGFFSDEKGSQEFPVFILKLMYPSRGNYIAVVGRLKKARFTTQVKKAMKRAGTIPVYSIDATPSLPGVDFSDHRNYWKLGYDAVMITDTAFYRNKNYHKDSDTAETLDYERMSGVVIAVYEAVMRIQ